MDIYIWEKTPDFVNEKGIKWWLDKSSTDYAQKENIRGTRLPGVQVFYAEFPDGYRTRVIVQNKQPVYESQGLEAIAVHIDQMKAEKEFDANERSTEGVLQSAAGQRRSNR
jgi:hypothetical protein